MKSKTKKKLRALEQRLQAVEDVVLPELRNAPQEASKAVRAVKDAPQA